MRLTFCFQRTFCVFLQKLIIAIPISSKRAIELAKTTEDMIAEGVSRITIPCSPYDVVNVPWENRKINPEEIEIPTKKNRLIMIANFVFLFSFFIIFFSLGI